MSPSLPSSHLSIYNHALRTDFLLESHLAYQLTNHPIVVHWDMDVAVLQPLDDLYDVMMYPSSHPIHMAARERIERQHPEEPWPERVDAFLTRDVTSAKPWEKVTAVQGGFLVARPDAGE